MPGILDAVKELCVTKVVEPKDNGTPVLPTRRPRMMIGVAAFAGVLPQAQENFFALAYRLGRDMPEWDVFPKILTKREQFRARNNIFDLALINDVDWLLMLDDDMMLPPKLVQRLMAHNKDICGALYFQRGGAYHPVIMRQYEEKDGLRGVDFIRHFDPMLVSRGLYQLKGGVIGGGCMLIRKNVIQRFQQPVFWVDGIVGTDVHFCTKAQEQGYEVWVDTSIELGHVPNEGEVITSRTIPHYARSLALLNEQLWEDLRTYYQCDDLQLEQMITKATSKQYRKDRWVAEPRDTWEQVKKYYTDDGDDHILNVSGFNLKYDQVRDWAINDASKILTKGAKVIDLGCGPGYTSFAMAEQGYHVTAYDLEGCKTLEFLRWRKEQHNAQTLTVTAFPGPSPEDDTPDVGDIDMVMIISVIDHAWEPYELVKWAHRQLKVGGYVLCDSWRSIANDEEPQHLIRFEAASFARWMEAHGWEVVPENGFLFRKLS